MQSILRSTRFPARTLRPSLLPSTPRRYAAESYGGSQSGHQQVNKDTPNPKEHLEHPGREAPADKGPAQSGQSQGSDSQSQPTSTSGGKPAIHQPGPPPENDNAEVEAHNKDMEKRSDRTANQLHEEDNKVNKNFWSGPQCPRLPPLVLSCPFSAPALAYRICLLTNIVPKQVTLDQNLGRRAINNKNELNLLWDCKKERRSQSITLYLIKEMYDIGPLLSCC